VQSWIQGTDYENLRNLWVDHGGKKDQLFTYISQNIEYRYSWGTTAFLTILSKKLGIDYESLPLKIKYLPTFLKYGINDVKACLFRSLGVLNRNTSLKLSQHIDSIYPEKVISFLLNLNEIDLGRMGISTSFDKNNIFEVINKLNSHRPIIKTPSDFDF
jgi:hypothetical protein